MERRIFVSLLAASPWALAQSSPEAFNGKWDITIPNESRRRAWWLEIKNAGSGNPGGSFIGAPGGGLNEITDAKIENGVLTWSFDTFRKGPGRDAPKFKGVYTARLVNGKLEGNLKVEGDPAINWIGSRAPKFKAVDLGKLKQGKPVELFNGRDLTGWEPTRTSGTMLWKAENGILKNQPGTTDIMTTGKFWNFKLHAEYRVGENSNSGIGLRGRYEIQILQDYGRPPSKHSNGALYSRVVPAKNASKPANEWQTYDITLAENRLMVVLNGETIHNNIEVEGLTAIAIDPHEGEPGPIVIQGDHGPVEFRKITLTPLV
jgi:hypothetical protein